jgi:hypothetical protein
LDFRFWILDCKKSLTETVIVLNPDFDCGPGVINGLKIVFTSESYHSQAVFPAKAGNQSKSGFRLSLE